MAEKFNEYSMDDMMTLAKSPAGQQLFAMLRQSAGEDLRQAMKKAAAGDLAGAQTILSPALSDPKIRALLEQMGGV